MGAAKAQREPRRCAHADGGRVRLFPRHLNWSRPMRCREPLLRTAG